MSTFRTILGYSVATAATVPLVLAGSGIAHAMGGALPGSVYFTSNSDSITAHIDASRGITNCALFVNDGHPDNAPDSGWSSDTTITVWVAPGTYTAALNCKEDGSAEWHNVKQEQVNVPPSLIDQLIDILETGSS